MKLRIFRSLRPVLVILGWATSSATLTLATIFQGQLIPKDINGGGLYSAVLNASPSVLWVFYLGNFGISLLAAMIIGETGASFISVFASILSAAGLTFLVLALPDLLGVVYDPQQTIQQSAVTFTFVAFFPLLLLVNLMGTVVGVALGDRLL